MADLFEQALQHHHRGELQQAATLYQQILDQEPQHADALHMLGVVLHQANQHERALPLIQRAVELRADQPTFYCNLASVHRALAQTDQALLCCARALQLQPDLFEAHLIRGLALLRAQRLAEAETALRDVLQRRPDDVRGHIYLGECLCALGRFQEARASFALALERQPQSGAAHIGLGTAWMRSGDAHLALTHFQQGVQLQPHSAQALDNLAQCLMELGRINEALSVFDDAMRLDPNVNAICLHIGQAWLEAGDLDEADGWFQRVLRQQAENLEALTGLGDVLAARGQPEQAIVHYQKVLQRHPEAAPTLGRLADALWDIGERGAALDLCKKLVVMQPERADRHARHGDRLFACGDVEAAVTNYRAALEKDSRCVPALAGIAVALRAQLPTADQEQLTKLLATMPRLDHRAALAFGAARIHEDRGEYPQAAECLQSANRWWRKHCLERDRKFDHDAHSQIVDLVIQQHSPEFFERTKSFGIETHRPVFVIGMPRTGVTLVERMLASHPQVFAAGGRRCARQAFDYLPHIMSEEIQPLFCLPKLTRAAAQSCAHWYLEQLQRIDGARNPRIVDATLENYLYLGLLATLFPEARIVHCRRDPRDFALSCFRTKDEALLWSNELAEIARWYTDYQRLLAHWRQVLPGRIHEIDYEALVADPDGVSRNLIRALGLPWSQACAEQDGPVRLVRSSGGAQVRVPFVRHGVGRWRNYSDLVAPFVQALPPQPQPPP